MGDSSQNHEIYLNERQSLKSFQLESYKSFDKWLLTLSSGAFGISLAFIRQIAPKPDPETIVFIIIAWIGFCLAILTTLSSFLSSQRGFSKLIEELDLEYETGKEASMAKSDRWRAVVLTLNIFSILFFMIGVSCICVFAIKNLTI